MSPKNHILSVSLILVCYSGIIYGLQCYRCEWLKDGHQDSGCESTDRDEQYLVGRPGNSSYDTNFDVEEEPWRATENEFCRKQVEEHFGKIISIKRSLYRTSDISIEEGCVVIYRDSDGDKVYDCYCTENGCNFAGVTAASVTTVIFLAIATFIVVE